MIRPGYERVAELCGELAAQDPTWGAQLAVVVGGELVVDLAVGVPADALLPVYSSSKGCGGIVMGLLLQRGQLDLDAPVAAYWPEFAAAGKQAVSVRQLLSHQAGLVGVDGGFSVAELLAHDPLAARLAAQAPLWEPGTAHGYHALTIGTLADELVRRITGRTLAEIFRAEVSADVHLGTPAELDHRVTSVDLPHAEELAEWGAVLPAPARFAKDAEPLGASLFFMVNDVFYRRAGQPASGALATARGLAQMYASSSVPVASVEQNVQGVDLVAGRDTRYGVVFELPTAAFPFGGPGAYGHGGLGGSVAFCDPSRELAFGFIPKRLPSPAGMAQVLELIRAAQR